VGYNIEYENYHNSWSGDGDYADWYEHNNYSPTSLSWVDGYSDVDFFPGQKEIEPGEGAYLVYVVYGSGDSFGHSTGNVCWLWVFSSKEDAHEFGDWLDTDAKDFPDYDFGNKPRNFRGVPIPTNTWKGYFEIYEMAKVTKLPITKKGVH
jgi:hypothetical protein